MPKILSSWSMTNDGKLIENDLKLSYSEEDGSYTIESKHESIGIILGLDQASHKYTIITSIPDTQRMSRFKPFVNVGDILVAINDQIIVEEGFKDVTKRLESLVKAGTPRKLTFLNRDKYSIDLFITKLQLNQQIQTDLLGFICSPEDSIIEKQYQYLNSNYLQSRDLEWVHYLKSIGGIENLKPAGLFKPLKDLKMMVRKGIPVAYRASIWPKISLSSIYRLQFPRNYYETLLQRVKAELSERVKTDIEKDVDRTFPEHRYFNPNGSGEDSLRRILHAFALHNPTVEYCQSLNFLAGMMLIFMSEEEAFWLLLTVVEKLLPADYYTKSMVGTYVDQFVLAHIIKKYLPNIHRSLEQNQLQLPLITVQWFMCLFVNTLRPEVTLRIWDMFLNEGSKVLFRIAAALFKIHEKELVAVKDAGDLFTALRKIGRDVVDADILIAAAYKSYSPNNPSAKILNASSSPSLSATNSGKSVNSAAQRLSMSAKFSTNKVPPPPLFPTATGKGNSAQNNNGSQSTNQGAYKASPKTSLSFKKHPLHDVSPRLATHGDSGKVPNPLQGVGLAHVGPIGERPLPVRYESVTDIASYVWDLADGTIPFEFDQDLMKSANQMSDNLLSAEAYESKSSGIAEEQQEVTNEETGKVVSSENSSKGADSGNGETGLANSHPSSTGKSESHDAAAVFSDPSIILNHFRDSQIGRNSSSSYLHPTSSANGKPKRNRKFRTGEFTFTRADIAVWRNTFRPGLQDRYERMEKARADYIKEKEFTNLAKVSLDTTTTTNEALPAAIKIPAVNLSSVSDESISRDQSGKGEINTSSSSSPMNKGISPRRGTASSSSVSPAITPHSARRSIESAALSPSSFVDVEAINTNYDLDHQFDK